MKNESDDALQQAMMYDVFVGGRKKEQQNTAEIPRDVHNHPCQVGDLCFKKKFISESYLLLSWNI